MARRLGLAETLQKTVEQPTPEAKGEYIRKNFTPALGILINDVFNPDMEYILPEGTPPYKPSEFLDQQSAFFGEIRKLYVFRKGTGDHIDPGKRETLFIKLLEQLDPEDAKLMVGVKDKRLPYGIKIKDIFEWLPGFLNPAWIDAPRKVTVVESAKKPSKPVKVQPIKDLFPEPDKQDEPSKTAYVGTVTDDSELPEELQGRVVHVQTISEEKTETETGNLVAQPKEKRPSSPARVAAMAKARAALAEKREAKKKAKSEATDA